MYKEQRTVFITKDREPSLMARINLLGELKNLKPSVAIRLLLDENLPKVKDKDGKID
jgi:hypothetical protein